MPRINRNKILLTLGLSLTFSIGLALFFLSTPAVQALNVNVNSTVISPGCGVNGLEPELGEVCDDGNTVDCDGCASDCSRVDNDCSDDILECGEECIVDSDCGDDTPCNNCVCGVPCFLAGTQISLANGESLPIEAVQIGDFVISYNELTGQNEATEVLETFQHQTNQYLIINNELKVTANHPLFVNGQWLDAGKIKINDKLLTEDGQKIVVTSIENLTESVLVYNLEVDKNHNYFAEKYLAHNKGCTPSCAGKECGTDGCYGTCGTCGSGYSCIAYQCVADADCGNDIIEPGEQCDDGAANNSDTEPDACRPTNCEDGAQCCNSWCGDGIVDTGEACDDTSDLCCTSGCNIDFFVTAQATGLTNTTATIIWQIPCQTADDVTLEWENLIDPSDAGFAPSLAAITSFTITDLTPDTTYSYAVTATVGVQVAADDGSFHTLGGEEICDNGIDDDSDGLCDYPASTCTDGSFPGDPECVCSADFECTPGDCREDGFWTLTCVDQTSPKCEVDYDYDAECACDLPCGACQHPDENCVVCLDDPAPCCGNSLCESWAIPPEDYNSCFQDCPVDCISDWGLCDDPEYGWGPIPCPESGEQTRICTDSKGCPISTDEPDTIRVCGGICTGLTCNLPCQRPPEDPQSVEECVCEELVPCCGNLFCEERETHEDCPQDCVEVCLPNWSLTGWGECVNGVQRRNYEDLKNCPYTLVPPPDERCCLEGCDVACGLCQTIDINLQICIPVSPCCGDRICEISQGENVLNCPSDCGLPPGLVITLPDCLDGLDNDNDGFVDYPADPGCSSPLDNSELNLAEILQNIRDFLRDQFFDNPQVEQVNKIAIPVLIATIAVNTFATFTFFNFLSYLQFFITQPFAALFRRKRRKWGVVYNSLSKQPVDLAIVRLYKKENARLVQSRVTDKLGRFSFLADPGRYYLTVTKPKYDFPTQHLKDLKEDVKYLDIYHGETIEVTVQRVDIVVNIPVDPQVEEKPVAKVIFLHYLRKVQYAAAFSAIPLSTISMAINPGALTFTMFGFHCLLFVLFRRLGYQKPPKNWGIIFDKDNKKPIGRAITRIYDKQYNKLLETRVTDGGGRYSFLVNNNIYYVTAEKLGYKPFKTDDIDLVSKDREAVVGMDIGLDKGKPGEVPPTPPAAPAPPTTPAASTPIQPEKPVEEKPTEPSLEEKVEELKVDRESLEELAKAKEEVKEIKEDIEEKKEDLEKLEEKVEDVEESIEEKLDKIDAGDGKQDKQDKQDKSVSKISQTEQKPEPELPKQESKPEEKPKPEDKTETPTPEKSIFG